MKVTFNNNPHPVMDILKERVDDYFNKNKISRYGNKVLYGKTVLLFTLLIYLYTSLVFFNLPTWIALIECVLLGICFACIGFNIMHDAVHEAYSPKKWVNDALGYSLNLMGANKRLWYYKHNRAHHTYVNIDHHDSDIEIPFMRTHHDQPLRWYHKFQHIYCWILYATAYFAWVFILDFKKYVKQKVCSTKIEFEAKDHAVFWMTKVFYLAVFIIVPFLMKPWYAALIGIALCLFTCGLFISVVFQMAHVVEKTQMVDEPEDGKIKEEWAVHQLNTTANFNPDNALLNFFLGGLNFQAVHHLFPRISHVHYRAINKIIRDTCMELGIPYHEYPTFRDAIKSHVRLLIKRGKPEDNLPLAA